jgi:O-antigen ligase
VSAQPVETRREAFSASAAVVWHGTIRALQRADAAVFLVVLVVLLLGIPSALIFHPLGAAGTPANMLGMLMLLWWAAARLVPGLGVSARLQPIRIAMGIFVVIVLASYVSGMLHGWGMPVGLQERTAFGSGTLDPASLGEVAVKEINAADRGLLSLAAWTGIALVAADGLHSKRRLDMVLKTIVVMGTFVAFLGMLQYFFALDLVKYFKIPGLTPNSDFGSIALRTVRRVEGTAVHPIEYGVVLSAILPIAIHRAIYAPRGRRFFPWLAAGVIGVALPMSVSRSAILALFVAAVVMFAGWPTSRKIKGLVVAVVFGVGMKLMVHGLLGTVRSLFTNLGNDPSIEGRTEDYSVALRLFHEQPLLGRGFFTFIPALYRTFDNAYLLAIVEIGILGTLGLVVVFLTGIFTARGARLRATDDEARDLGQVLAASLSAVMVSAATFDMLGFPMAAGLTFLLVGCSGALWRLSRDQSAVTSAVVEGGPSVRASKSNSDMSRTRRAGVPA